jgi:hypothetical protein
MAARSFGLIAYIWKGELASPPANPAQNWIYRNTADKAVYLYDAGAWVLMVRDGQEGPPGGSGYSPQVTVKTETADTYILEITFKQPDGSIATITTPNLRGGSGSGNKQDKIPPASDYHRYIVQQPANGSEAGDITFTKNGDILTLPAPLKLFLQAIGFVSDAAYDELFVNYAAEDFMDTLTFNLTNYDIAHNNYLNLPRIFESGILNGTVYLQGLFRSGISLSARFFCLNIVYRLQNDDGSFTNGSSPLVGSITWIKPSGGTAFNIQNWNILNISAQQINNLVVKTMRGGVGDDKTNDVIGYRKLWKIATIRSPKRQENSLWYADLIEVKLTGSFRGGGFDGNGDPADVEYTIIANEIITCKQNEINTSCKIISGSDAVPAQLNLIIEQQEVNISGSEKYIYYHFWMYKATSSSGLDSNIGYLAINDVNYFGNDGDMADSQIEFFNPAAESKDDISELTGFNVIANGVTGS